MRTTSSQRRLAAITAVGAMAVLLPGIAVAQSGFGDVPSNYVHAPGIDYVADAGITAGCGDGSDYCPNDAVTRGQMATFLHRSSGNAPGIAPSVDAATLGGQTAEEIAAGAAGGFVPFSVTLDFGEEADLVTYGDLTYTARCVAEDGGGDPFEQLEVVVTSAEDGWFSTSAGGPLLASDEDVMFSTSSAVGDTEFDQDIDDGTAISAGGDYLALQGETLALGLNVAGNDCLVAGVAFTQDVAL